MICQAVPRSMSPSAKSSISSEVVPQYLTIGFCCLSRSTAAANWSLSSAYGLVILSSGLVFIRYERGIRDVDRRVVGVTLPL